jgi:hypothetical protein
VFKKIYGIEIGTTDYDYNIEYFKNQVEVPLIKSIPK